MLMFGGPAQITSWNPDRTYAVYRLHHLGWKTEWLFFGWKKWIPLQV